MERTNRRAAVGEAADLIGFYEQAYTPDPARSAQYGRWRALGARGKADHVIDLCRRAGVTPASTLDVGCGDGALLCELHLRGFGGRLTGLEISQAAVELARERPQIDSVERYDGVRVPARERQYDLGILSHVLEHVPEPAELVSEVARACRAVLVELPLEANLSARRAVKRRHAAEIGHLQRLDRSAARAIVRRAGLRIACELVDPLPRSVHLFGVAGRRGRAGAEAKWATRAAIHGLAPAVARRLFTVHYACLCVLPASD